ncbi:oxidoreductase TDA3 [Micractinium conductrix]|uniref:Oxidoreductase TDA3 n=1 Tax=Micractinium conductrix TaxID=554055 RepID=A0A2P6VF01_9CHLO|nr:oxidoreductase TDA3 [Micractinium conductrix]|eukprot:PSC72675.1 oxidoreductase TDA3 [Micractinium conductrix]
MAAPQVLVVGGGLIGAATAFYLSKKGAKPIVLEAVSPACSASGKAGGFLALDWCDSQATGPLARRSFALHEQLAKELGTDCGYRRVRTHSISVKPGATGAHAAGGASAVRRPPSLPGWVDTENIGQASVIGTEETTAQVHPELLTKALLAAAEAAGGSLQLAAAVGLRLAGEDDSGGGGGGGGAEGQRHVAEVRVRDRASGEEREVAADAVVFCMGAWSAQLRSWLPQLGGLEVSGLKVHSIVLADPPHRPTTADALFLAYRGSDGKSLEPEVYPRPNGQVYVCDVSEDDVAVPATAADVLPRPDAIATLQGVAASVSKDLGAAELLQGQACLLPCTADGLPVIGRVPGLANAYVATGHSCWGILQAPATGEAVAELVVDGAARSTNLRAFDPARLARQAARRQR